MTKEERKEYMKKWGGANRESIAARKKAYYIANREKMRLQHREYYKKNAKSLSLHKKRFNATNPGKKKRQAREYYLNNPEKAAIKCRKRKAKVHGVGHVRYKSNDIFERDGWVCGVCGQKINKRLKHPNPRSKSIDHIAPLSKGGADAPINVQAAHLRCNLSKNAGGGGQLRLMG